MTTITNLQQLTQVSESYELAVDTDLQTFAMSIRQLRDFLGNTFETIEHAAGYETRAGTVILSPLNTMEGFLIMQGAAVSRTTYATLFNLIGTTFGRGDGGTTFNLPDMRGVFLRGFGGSSAAIGTRQAQGLPNILGSLSTVVGYGGLGKDGAFSGTTSGGLGIAYHQSGTFAMYPKFDASQSNSIYGAADEVRPQNMALNFFIKY